MNRFITCFLVVLFLLTGPFSFGAEPPVFKAGAGLVDITPSVFKYNTIGNYVSDIADTVKDPLYARCLILDDGTERIVLLVLDLCHVGFPVTEKMKELITQKTGIPKDRIMISTTHTHSAPHLGLEKKEGETRFTLENAVEAAVEANKNLVPAKIGWAVGNDQNNVFCRRFIMQKGKALNNPGMSLPDRIQMNPGGNPAKVSPAAPVDTLIPMLSVVSKDGTPIALFANYSSHHGSRGLGNKEFSGDRFGVFAEEMKRRIAETVKNNTGKEKMSEKFVAIMAQGTSGDANCHNYLDAQRKYDYKSVGIDNAEAAMLVWPNIQYFDHVPLGMTERRLRLPRFKPSPEEVAAAQAVLADEAAMKRSVTLARSIRETVNPKLWEGDVDVPLQAMRVGEFGMTTLPGEFFGITGIDLKAKSPFQPTMNIGLANATCGYVPPPEQFDLGGYESWRSTYSCLGREAEPIVKQNLLEMLQELRNQDPATISQRKFNTLSPEEAAEGFVLLFDGKTISPQVWQGDLENYPVEDGAIVCRGKHLMTRENYDDFVFRCEFKVPPGGNNGIGFRCPSAEGTGAWEGLESQILDHHHEKYKDKLHVYQYHGSIYGVIPARRNPEKNDYLKPVGQWNETEVSVVGSRVKVVLNGETIVDADLNDYKDKPTLSERRPKGLDRTDGCVGFQGHNDPVAFRNVRIKRASK